MSIASDRPVLARVAVLSAVNLHPRPPGREEATLLTGIALLAAATFGLMSGRWWGRWLGLAIGLVCTSFGGFDLAMVLAERLSHPTDAQASIAMALAGPVLLICLSGPAMFDRYDRRAGYSTGRRPLLVRWAAVTNLSSLVTLVLLSFAVFDHGSRDHAHWQLALLCAALVLSGVVMLARGKTMGLVLAVVAASSEILLTASIRPTGSRVIFGTLLSPGLVMVAVVAVAYSGPIWRFLRPR